MPSSGAEALLRPREIDRWAIRTPPFRRSSPLCRSSWGLKLERQKIPVELLVIDHIDKEPVAN
jgi:hypothetical protein